MALVRNAPPRVLALHLPTSLVSGRDIRRTLKLVKFAAWCVSQQRVLADLTDVVELSHTLKSLASCAKKSALSSIEAAVQKKALEAGLLDFARRFYECTRQNLTLNSF